MEDFDIIDVPSSSDNDDFLIISRSDAVSPPCNNNSSSSTSREAGIKKEEDQVALFSAAAVVDAASSHNKRRRRRSSSRAEKKKERPSAAELDIAAAAAYYKKCRVVERKKKPLITIDKKIPAGVLITNLTNGSIKFNVHKSLANKKVLLYGLSGFHQSRVAHSTGSEEFKKHCEKWRPFFQNSFVEPVLDFIKNAADYLKKNGVDETVFLSVTGNGLMLALKNREIRKRSKYVTIVTDYDDRYLHALGMEMDIPQIGMPPRSRRFILLVDNLMVKFARIESSDGNFTIPNNEEIIKAFDQ